MSLGPGNYDDFCTMVREDVRAEACVLMVVNGTRGNGFSVQATPEFHLKLPAALRTMADLLEREIPRDLIKGTETGTENP